MWVINERFGEETRFRPTIREKDQFRGVAARLGALGIDIPAHWARYSDAATALRRCPAPSLPTPAVLNGCIHQQDDYAELYEACRARNLYLLNSPEEYARAHSLVLAYPRLGALTPQTRFASRPEELRAAAEAIGLPVFVKGAVQSLKIRGWSRCVAESVEALDRIAHDLWDDYDLSAGVIAVRALAPLRHVRRKPDGFPIGREFRVFLYRGEVLACGYYWSGEDELSSLSEDEERAVRALARAAAAAVEVPYLIVDIGQREDGRWIVIECGDPQSCGFGHVQIEALVAALIAAVERARPGV